MSKDIPKVAYQIPDLDAYARIELVDRSTGKVAACLQATITNGQTVELTIVKWVTGAVTLLAVILAMMQSIRKRSSSPALYRWFDFLSLWQNCAASGMMFLNYPGVWMKFTRNFAWSMGLLYDKHMQNTINKIRMNGGGKMPYTAYEDIPSINSTLTGKGINLDNLGNIASGNLTGALGLLGSTSINSNGNGTSITVGSRSLFTRAFVPESASHSGISSINVGIPMYVNAQGIPVANAMSTVFFFILIFLGVSVVVHVLIGLVVGVLSLFGKNAPKWVVHLRRTFWEFCVGNFTRAALGWAFPVAIFSFFQWRLGKSDATVPIIFGVLGWVVTLLPLIIIFLFCWNKNHKESLKNPNISRLWTDYRFFHAFGLLYRQYKPNEHYFWFNPVVLGIITKAGFIAFGHKNQWAQVIGCMVVEFGTFINIVIFRSFRGVWNNILGALLAFFRLAMFGLLVPYIDSINLGNPNDTIPPGAKRTIMGVVQIALVAIPAVFLVFDSIWQAVYDLAHFHRRHDDFEDLESPYPEDQEEQDPTVKQALVGFDTEPYRDEMTKDDDWKPGHYPAGSFTDPYAPQEISTQHDYLGLGMPPRTSNEPTYNYNMPPNPNPPAGLAGPGGHSRTPSHAY